jgi:hypothetical protein
MDNPEPSLYNKQEGATTIPWQGVGASGSEALDTR